MMQCSLDIEPMLTHRDALCLRTIGVLRAFAVSAAVRFYDRQLRTVNRALCARTPHTCAPVYAIDSPQQCSDSERMRSKKCALTRVRAHCALRKKKSAAYGSQCLYSAWLLLSYMVAAAVVEESERERERRKGVSEESLRNVRGT